MKTFGIASCLSVYGITHALVDAGCIMLLLGGIDVREDLLAYILLYNVLAFGLQLPIGWLSDRLHQPVPVAITGVVLVSLSLMLFLHPLAAIILAGIGNALFHVGGGTIALNLQPEKASLPGVFVAPGGIGLFAGALILKLYGYHPLLFALPLLAMGTLILVVKSPPIFYAASKNRVGSTLDFAILLLLITICIRSMVGLSIEFPWKSNQLLLITLTASIALGKALGGFIADYLGWIKTAVGGLVIASILLIFGQQSAIAGITGLFFFNLTMPVTLVAISNVLPGRPGFSFGLTTFAILTGALPTFFSYKALFAISPVMFLAIIISAVTLYIGLKIISPKTSISKVIQP
jgi:FSR family fosmidomycin resistance protein-like MFS transporter